MLGPVQGEDAIKQSRDLGIWGFAFGYFACYIPYAATTKTLTSGKMAALEVVEGGQLAVVGYGVPGFTLLPLSVFFSMLGMLVFITAMGWWKYASTRNIAGRQLPCPTKWTFLSGLCTAGIIGTTTLAYTVDASIVFMMLLMRGGVLIIAPVVDALTGRHVRWFSYMGLLFALAALVVSFVGKRSFALSTIAIIDIALYLTCYFVRLRFMSRLAKSDDLNARTRYFVEEQMVASPFLFLTLAVLALINYGPQMNDLRVGFTSYLGGPFVVQTILIGILSQGTGIFGSLIFLDKRENAFCVPVNRSSSIMAGVIATYGLHYLIAPGPPDSYQLGGAGLIIGAILFLTIPPLLDKRRAAQAA